MEILLWNVLFAALPIIAVGVVAVALFVIDRRRRVTAQSGEEERTQTSELARVVAILAFLYGLAAAIGAFMAAVVTISTGARGGAGVNSMTLPVPASSTTAIPDTVLPPVELGGELLSFGHFSEIAITGFGLSPGTALLYFAPAFLTPLMHAIVAFGISSLATRIERNEGFAPQLAKTAAVVGVSLIVIGSLSQAMQFYGTSLARYELLGGTDLGGWVGPEPVDLTHVAAGVGVLLVAVLLRRGVQLEHDTKGLV
ncbi:hypothetical protein [Microcella sp.]|uniref:hypothetical protein n=1 Tax=Microcella sp. TaxID=1913979 RepID=UPI00299F613A|nr:hypothetical protein [Microcella sp.]MDX2026041.1 hypothetical protein [Microcella sp.]